VKLVKDATNHGEYDDTIRGSVRALLFAKKNEKEIQKIITEVPDVLLKLIEPFNCDEKDAILDTWILKTLLNVILNLIGKFKLSVWKNGRDQKSINKLQASIEKTKKKWANDVKHPTGIESLNCYKSQQIEMVCDKCLEALDEKK